MPQYAETECKFNIGKISLKKKGMKKMKKLLAWILSMSMILTSCGLTALAVEVSSATTLYSQTFDDAASINDFTMVAGGAALSYNETDKSATLSKYGSRTIYLLPETVNYSNFVIDADVIPSSIQDENLNFGFVFNYADTKNFARMMYYANREKNLFLAGIVDGTSKAWEIYNGTGASSLTAVGEKAHLKMIVNNGKMEFFVNGELCYTYTSGTGSKIGEIDFTKGGRIGLEVQAGQISVDNVTVKTIDSTSYDNAYYANSFNDEKAALNLVNVTNKNSFTAGIRGAATYSDNGNTCLWHIPTAIKGNYVAEMNLSFVETTATPDTGRWLGFAYGISEDKASYNSAIVRLNGKTDAGTTGNYTAGTPKTNTLPAFEYYTKTGTNETSKRHNLRLVVEDKRAKFFVDGALACTYSNIGTTDGYVGIITNGLGANVYSLRVSPLEKVNTYEADFTNTNELAKWDNLYGTNAPSLSNGKLVWGASNTDTAYLLPTRSLTNFVAETEITNTAGEYRIGFVFGSDGTSTSINDSKIMMFTDANIYRPQLYLESGTTPVRESKEAYSYTLNNGTESKGTRTTKLKSKLKLVVYNKYLAAWVDDQLIFTYALSDYTGGRVGLFIDYYAIEMSSLSVRPATAEDMLLAASFNETDKNIGALERITANTGGVISSQQDGSATWGKMGGTVLYAKKDVNCGDHVYSSSFTFGTDHNGPTRFISPVFGLNKNDDGTYSMIATHVKYNGEVSVQKVTLGSNLTDVSWGTVYGTANIYDMFPDNHSTITYNDAEHNVLQSDIPWRYKHVLNNGTLDIYINDVKALSVTNNAFKDLKGDVGILQNGVSSVLRYIGVRGVEDADLTQKYTGKILYSDGNVSIAAPGLIARIYDAEGNLFTTAVSDANGGYVAKLRNATEYSVKISDASGKLLLEDTMTYDVNSEKNFTIVDTAKDLSSVLNVDFADGIKDNSINGYTLKAVERTQVALAEREEMGGSTALVLDGVGDAVYVDEEITMNDLSAVTAEAVFMPEERKGIKTMTVLGGFQPQGTTWLGYGLYVDEIDGVNSIVFKANIDGVVKSVSTPCEMNTLYYAAGVFDGENMNLYVNGELKATAAAAGELVIKGTKTTKTGIGAEWYSLNDHRKYFFKGIIGSVKVSNYAIDAKSISDKYAEYYGEGYLFEEDLSDDVVVNVAFDKDVYSKGETATATVTVSNNTNAEKTLNIKMVPGYFAALTSASDTATVTSGANSSATAEFTYAVLQGGREPFKAYVSENGVAVAEESATITVSGAGFYKGDIHSHTTYSDAVNTFEENVKEAFATKNLSWNYATDHNMYGYWYKNRINGVNNSFANGEYIMMAGSELTTNYGHANTYNLNNDVSTAELSAANAPFWHENKPAANSIVTEDTGAGTLNGWQNAVDIVENDYEGAIYLNHFQDEPYVISEDIIKDLRNYTGLEAWSGYEPYGAELTLKQMEIWDKANSIGWSHIIGHGSTDAHGAAFVGGVQLVAYMDELSQSEINRVMLDGSSFTTNGVEVRFDINGADLSKTAKIVNDAEEATFNVNVYDPNGDILQVNLIKNVVSGEYTTANKEVISLFTKGDEAVGEWKNSFKRAVNDNEFYRVEVITAKAVYDAISGTGQSQEGETAGKGYAFTNNIWIEKADKSNSTNISEISYNGNDLTVKELPTGIKYIEGNGNFAPSSLKVTADGAVNTTVENNLVTITVTADDGTVSSTQMYLVGDIQTVLGETEIVVDESTVEIDTTYVTAQISVNDVEGLITSSAKLILAVYDNGVLLGADAVDISADSLVAEPIVEYDEVEDASTLSTKVFLFDSLNGMLPLADCVPLQ